jgi:hypothetical protein
MAYIGGKDTTWKHATHGSPSSDNDYTGKTMSVEPTYDGETVDATVFGDTFREKVATFKEHAYKVRYLFDAAMWTVITDLWKNGTAVTFELGPIGTTAGNPKSTGTMVCRSFTQPFNVGEVQVMDVEFEGSGAVVFDVFS